MREKFKALEDQYWRIVEFQKERINENEKNNNNKITKEFL